MTINEIRKFHGLKEIEEGGFEVNDFIMEQFEKFKNIDMKDYIDISFKVENIDNMK